MKHIRAHYSRAFENTGPIFAIAALLAPGVIAFTNSTAITASIRVQQSLLTFGLSTALVSIALAMYRWSFPRRLLHLLLLCILLELFYRVAYGGPVSSGLLLAVPETSGSETMELLVGHPILTASLSAVALVGIGALIASWNTRIRFSKRRCLQVGMLSLSMIFASLVLAIASFSVGDGRGINSVVISQIRDTFPFDIATAVGAVAAGSLDARRQASIRDRFQFPHVRMTDAEARRGSTEIYVVIIGETSRRADWSLFGYPRITSPQLDAIASDLALFNHVSSNATNTILSVPMALTRASPITRNVVRSERSIITLLKQAGFRTFWISNQERSGVLSNAISDIALEADTQNYSESGEFDSNLVIRLDDQLAHLPQGGKAVIFLHMEGSHFAYRNRYPPAFEHFSAEDLAPRSLPEPQLRLVNEYDNTVYFSDHVVRGVIDRLALCECKAGLVFFSDHGERLFDNGLTDSDFGHGFPTVSRQEIDIPFFVWLSAAYRDANPHSVARLDANTQKVAQLHNLFETITDLAGVEYDNRDENLSLFSDRLKSLSTLEVLNMKEETISLAAEKR